MDRIVKLAFVLASITGIWAGLGVAPVKQLNSGKHIPGFGLGTWLGRDSKPASPDDDSVQKAVEWAIDAGYRHIDTAAVYKTEPQVGRAISNKINEGLIKRDEVFITTKLWNDAHATEEVVPALQDSLQRLNMSYVDLYLVHWPTGQFQNETPNSIDYLDTWKGMIDARDRGLVRSIGVSNFNVQQLDRLITASHVTPAVLQVELNLNLQQPELLKFCCEHNITVMAYTPFGSIFPSKAAADAPPPRVDDQDLVKVAEKYNKTVPQIVLRYLVELGAVPIPKSVTKERIEQNINIFDFELNAEDKKLLKSYDRGYRTIVPHFLKSSPYYPFEDNTTTTTVKN